MGSRLKTRHTAARFLIGSRIQAIQRLNVTLTRKADESQLNFDGLMPPLIQLNRID
jgi:hypothetical protein